MKDSFYLFSFKGIPVKVHWTLLLFIAFRLFQDNDPTAFKWNVAMVTILTVSVIVHEFGHALTARSLGGQAHQIVLWPLGGLAYTSGHRTLQNSLKVTLAGPLTHIPLSVLFALGAFAVDGKFSWYAFVPLYGLMPPCSFWGGVLIIGAKVQMMLFLFNLFVPAYPLDSGHAIVELMLIKGKSPDFTAKVIIVTSFVAALVLMLYFQVFVIGIFILYSIWQLNELRQQGALGAHPLFAMALGLRNDPGPKPRPKHLSLVKTKKRVCPTCKREVAKNAKMCGFCEKPL